MKSWYFIVGAGVILAGLVCLVYAPFVLTSSDKPDDQDVGRDVQSGQSGEGEVLTFCSDSWPPYAGTAGAQQEGYIVDVLREIYEPLGYEVRYTNAPWTRCIADVRSGAQTGLAGCDVHEAPDLIYPRETIGTTRPTFFVLRGARWRYDGVGSLSEIRLGAIQDYTYERTVDVYIRQHRGTDRITLTGGNDALLQLIRLVRAGRIDALVENAPVVDRVVAALGEDIDDIVPAGEAPGLRLFVPFSDRNPNSREYARIFDRRIGELRSDGRLAEILSAYGLTDWLEHEATLQGGEGG